MSRNTCRDPQGRFAPDSVAGVYDALDREMRRLAELRTADNEAHEDAITATREAAKIALDASKEAIAKAEQAQLRYDTGPPSLQTLQADVTEKSGASAAVDQGWKYVLALAALAVPIVLYLLNQKP